jgi:aryl-alcohol dehydrogenase-like predicted oxidoreductase
MIEIPEISKIGYGAYRVDRTSKEHFESLKYALDCGCNLIDTASNYTGGSSEELIGDVLASVPEKHIFVITKAGYLSGKTLQLYEGLNIKDDSIVEPVTMPNSFMHSIHPDYLNAQLKVSQKRMKKPCVDCFLLHSPEYFFNFSGATTEEYYKRIERAFAFLEELAEKGSIRYYGVSSNSFSPSSIAKGLTSLKRIIGISKKISSNSRFKFIQFPYNLIENGAATSLDDDGKSLLDIAKENKIITLANRPLNANANNTLVRLEIENLAYLNLNSQADESSFLLYFDIIEKRLKNEMPDTDLSEIPILQLLKTNGMNIGNPESFTRIFRENFDPFIELLFEGGMSQHEKEAITGIEKLAWKYHVKSKTTNTKYWLQKLNKAYLLDGDSTESFTTNLIKDYLNSGIDHVLLGMRKREYVDSVKALLQER